jgi:uncharacterized protein YukE
LTTPGGDPTPRGSASASAGVIRVDDPTRLREGAAAFSEALGALHDARSRFASRVQGLGEDLGDATLASRYEEAYQRALGTVDEISHCFEEFARALTSAGTGYEETDSSVAGWMR